MGVFVDQRNFSSATEMAKLANLFYESKRDGNVKINAKEILILVPISTLNTKISRCRMLIRNRVKMASMQ